MLEFLPMLSAGLQGLSALSAMRDTAEGQQQTPAESMQLQAMANKERLLKALLNPDDPILKNLTASESQQTNNSIQQQLSNLLSANRRAQLMGRQTYFNPERQDEAISTFLNRAADTTANTARSNALKRIMEVANQYGSSASGYGGMVANQVNRQLANTGRTSSILGSAGDSLGSGGSLSNIFAMLSSTGGAGGGAGGMGSMASMFA